MLLQELLVETRPRLINLDEDVPIRNASHLAAYAITVAEAYDALPRLDPSAVPLWQAFAVQNEEVMLRKIGASGIKVEYMPNDPYEHLTDDPRMMVRYMLWDMVVNHRLLIYTGHSDDHPVFTAQQNVIFRTVHDYFAHGKLRAVFKKQIDAMGLANQKPTPDQLAKILPTIKLDQGGNIGHSFKLRGEINAYLTHSKIAKPSTIPVLFTEIVGQACYHNVVRDFPDQKVALLRGFNYRRVGLAESQQVQQRIDILTKEVTSEQTVQTSIAAKPQVNVADLLTTLAQ